MKEGRPRIDDRAARRLAMAALLFVLLAHAAALSFAFLAGLGTASGSGVFFVLLTLTFPVVGFVILRKQPRNTVGWVLMGIGVAATLGALMDAYASYGLGHAGSLPLTRYVAVVSSSWWAPVVVPIGTFLILLFPDGRLPSPRWRWVAWLAGGSTVATTIGIVLSPGKTEIEGFRPFTNPLGHGVVGTIGSILLVALPLVPISMVSCAVALVQRFRRSRGPERLQMKWLATSAALSAGLFLVAMAASIPRAWSSGGADPAWLVVVQSLAVFSLALIPISVGVAVLKYRLYEIDVVINKALVYGALAAFITVVYVAIVVGLGAAVGTVGHPNVGLSILATAVIAVAFGPAKERIQCVANRIVYGERATPYEVLSSFSTSLAGNVPLEELIPNMARTLAEGTGATRTEVWLRVGTEVRLAGAWPVAADTDVVAGAAAPEEDERTRVVAVSHDGEEMGWLVVRKDAGDQFTAIEEKLLRQVAAQAALVLRNVRLVEDLRASRQRLVAAQDEERRKLERNIHDGAQQRLVALAVRFNLARKLLGPEGNGIDATIQTLAERTQVALENLRDLARGIYPPLLADKGLVAALEAQARKIALPVTVEATNVERYPQDVEAAVYFCCLEALQNVVKHAGATRAVVALTGSSDAVSFEVRDDGSGFDPHATPLGSGLTNMGDRLAALGGTLEVRSRPGEGTTVAGRLPAPAREAVPA